MIKANEYYSWTIAGFAGIPEVAWGIVSGFFVLIYAWSRFSPSHRCNRYSPRKTRYEARNPLAQPRAPAADDKTPTHTALTFPSSPNVRDPKQQMEAFAFVDFEITPLLNREEARLLPLLESCVRQVREGHRVMAQTSMGEIIRPKHAGISEDQQRAAYASINSKRLDFTIFDRFGRLALAIEYQGSGHYQAKSFMRDAVKREVLRKAGVTFLEVAQDFQHDDVTRKVLGIIGPEKIQTLTTKPSNQ